MRLIVSKNLGKHQRYIIRKNTKHFKFSEEIQRSIKSSDVTKTSVITRGFHWSQLFMIFYILFFTLI